MDYAVMSNQPFITTKKIKTHKKPSAGAQSIRDFCKTHSVSISVNPVTREGTVTVTKRDE